MILSRQFQLKIKRVLDFTAALGLMIVLSPVFLVVAGLVWAKLGRPIIFRNPRLGKNAKIFNAYKFRSMLDLCDCNGKLLSDAERLTSFSKKFRATSLDELPQLWNVLKGEMSLIGPRPILTDFLPYLNDREMRRLEMLPGISGWAQVNGRNSIDWDARLEMDVWYVDNWSLMLDLKTALKTIPVWLGAQGITAPGHATFHRLDDVRAVQVEKSLTDA